MKNQSLHEITFWAKGKYKDDNNTTMKKYEHIELDRVKIFYANYRNINNILTVSSSKGDNITI